MKTYFIIFVATCVLVGNLVEIEASCAEPKCEGIQCAPVKCTLPEKEHRDPCRCCPFCADNPPAYWLLSIFLNIMMY
ncbi:unnamed protein product [Acanthoscelides obtectus]|uniref:Uncharacterized protein n=1 Tax=Acanthoscelides obtectus TaxID=200917 RepID=A0A9P0KAR9_ACAOB|nr:unnamed protein product [Acanthoscelides obtectus]CAK1667410.1 hypothetical protein AOBTE_LOCUS25820 [Acanthoscelides obtectus]